MTLPSAERAAQAAKRFGALLLLAVVLSGALVPAAAGFNPALVAATTTGDVPEEYNQTAAAEFRLRLDDLRACAWDPCNVTESAEVHVTIDGADRLTGSFTELYHINVSGVPSFTQNYTTIAVVLKGDVSNVVLQPDASAERTGSIAYTKVLNGSATMDVTLLPANQTGNITMYVFGYVGDGNRTTHGDHEVYALAKKEIPMRAQRIVPVNVTVGNDANVSVTDVTVSFFARGPKDTDYKPIGNATLGSIGPKGTGEAGVPWDVTWEAPEVYTVKAVVDPLHKHADAFEDNNVVFFEVNLGKHVDANPQAAASQIFFWVTLAVIAIVAVGLYWYNRVYE